MTTRIYLAQGKQLDPILITAQSLNDAANGLEARLQQDEPEGYISLRETGAFGDVMQVEFWADEFTTMEYTITLPEFYGSVEDLAA